MSPRRRRAWQRRPFVPLTPAHRRLCDLLPVNRGFYASFRDWLHQTGYSPSALNLYGVATRLALSVLAKPYWQIDPAADLDRVRAYLAEYFANPSTRREYDKGLKKLAHYLRHRLNKPAPVREVDWAHALAGLPPWLATAVKGYLRHRERGWPVERRFVLAGDAISRLVPMLRWMAGDARLRSLRDLTPKLWFAFADMRLAAGIQPVTVNDHLSSLQHFVEHAAEQGQPACQRLLQVKRLPEGPRLPKDVPPETLRQLLAAVQAAAQSPHGGARYLGLLDQAWVLLMLHSGLRTGEVRRLKLADIDWERRLVRIEQSKGLKDRLVPLSPAGLKALKAYLAVRGPADALPDAAFIFRHQPLTESYCSQRLSKTYGPRLGLHITPHQLRHSCATLLLNAGAPILTVQAVLGHKQIDTTLTYARLYDGTVAADYYRAMAQVERQLPLGDAAQAPAVLSPGELLALVDSLRAGTLNATQSAAVGRLRTGLLALVEQGGGKAPAS